MQAAQPHPADAFGGDVSYRSIAAQVENMKVRALTPTQYEDVVVLLEYMRDEALKLHQANLAAGKSLQEREEKVAQRERDVALRHRTVKAALKVQGRPRRWLLWR